MHPSLLYYHQVICDPRGPCFLAFLPPNFQRWELLGQGFAVIGMDVDPRAAVPRGARRFWERLGTTFIEIRRASGRIEARDDGRLLAVDVDGKLEAWFASAGAQLAVVRPDRFVFAAGGADRGPAMMSELCSALGVDWS